MIRSYRTYRNMDKKDRDEKQISVQLFQFASVFEWLVFETHEAVMECCHLFHHLPLPRWLANWESDWGCECTPPNSPPLFDDGCACWGRFGDYYGEEWGGIWHCYIEWPLQRYLDYRCKKSGREYHFIEVPLSYWDHLPKDADVNWIRGEIEREKGYPKGENGDTLAPMKCDFPGETWLYKLLEWATRPWRTPPCDGTGTQS